MNKDKPKTYKIDGKNFERIQALDNDIESAEEVMRKKADRFQLELDAHAKFVQSLRNDLSREIKLTLGLDPDAKDTPCMHLDVRYADHGFYMVEAVKHDNAEHPLTFLSKLFRSEEAKDKQSLS